MLLSCAFVVSSCSSASDEPEEQPGYVSTEVRAAAVFTELGGTEQISEVYVGKTYALKFTPFCPPLYDSLKDFVSGSVEKVYYWLDIPFKGKTLIGSSTKPPFTVEYTPTDVGGCILSATFDLSPSDHNKWVEVESVVYVLQAKEQ